MRVAGVCSSSPGLSGFLDTIQAFGSKVASFYNDVAAGAKLAVQWTGDKARSEIAAFRQKLAAYTAVYQSLQKNRPPLVVSSARLQEYNDLLASSKALAERAQWVENQIAAVEKATGVKLSGLGVLPAVVLAPAIVAAIVGITYLLSEGMQHITDYLNRNSYANAVQAKGGDVSKALENYDAQHKDEGLFGDASKLVWPIAIVGAMYLASK